MKKNFFVVGVKNNTPVSISGPFTIEEATATCSNKSRSRPDIEFDIVHKGELK